MQFVLKRTDYEFPDLWKIQRSKGKSKSTNIVQLSCTYWSSCLKVGSTKHTCFCSSDYRDFNLSLECQCQWPITLAPQGNTLQAWTHVILITKCRPISISRQTKFQGLPFSGSSSIVIFRVDQPFRTVFQQQIVRKVEIEGKT